MVELGELAGRQMSRARKVDALVPRCCSACRVASLRADAPVLPWPSASQAPLPSTPVTGRSSSRVPREPGHSGRDGPQLGVVAAEQDDGVGADAPVAPPRRPGSGSFPLTAPGHRCPLPNVGRPPETVPRERTLSPMAPVLLSDRLMRRCASQSQRGSPRRDRRRRYLDPASLSKRAHAHGIDRSEDASTRTIAVRHTHTQATNT